MDFSQVFACQISSVILRHYFNSFGNFRVFSIQIYQLYAYHISWARVAGSLIWARFSSKIQNAAPYPREVKMVRKALLKNNQASSTDGMQCSQCNAHIAFDMFSPLLKYILLLVLNGTAPN